MVNSELSVGAAARAAFLACRKAWVLEAAVELSADLLSGLIFASPFKPGWMAWVPDVAC